MGGVLIADELNLVSPEVLMALQEVFDMEEEIQNPVNKAKARLDPMFHFFATQNSAALLGRNVLPTHITMRSMIIDVPEYENQQVESILKRLAAKEHTAYLKKHGFAIPMRTVTQRFREKVASLCAEVFKASTKAWTLREMSKLFVRVCADADPEKNFSMHAYVLLGAVQRPKDAEIDASQMTSTDADMLVNCSSLLTQEQLQRMKFGIRTDTISWEFYFGELKKTSDETPDAPDEPLDETPDEPAWISVLHDVPNGVKKTADLVCEMVMGMGKEVVKGLCAAAFALKYQEPVLLEGPGSSGKSTIVELLSYMLRGPDSLITLRCSAGTSLQDFFGGIEPHNSETYQKHALAWMKQVDADPPADTASMAEIKRSLNRNPTEGIEKSDALLIDSYSKHVFKELEPCDTSGEKEKGQLFPLVERGLMIPFRVGKILLLKNLNEVDAAVLEHLNQLFASRKVTTANSERLAAHSQFQILATVRTPLSSDLSAAMRSRLTVVRLKRDTLSWETTFKADASQDQSPKDFTFPKAMPTLRHLGWASTATSALAALKQTRKVEDVTSPQSRGQSTPRGDMDQNESSLKEEDVRKLVKFALWVLFNDEAGVPSKHASTDGRLGEEGDIQDAATALSKQSSTAEIQEMKLQECLRLMKKTSQLFKPGEPGEPGDRTLVLTTELQKDRPDLPRELRITEPMEKILTRLLVFDFLSESVEAVRKGALVLLDEVNLLHETLLAQIAEVVGHSQVLNPEGCSPALQVRDEVLKLPHDGPRPKRPLFVAAMNPVTTGGGRSVLPPWFQELTCSLHVKAPSEDLAEILKSLYIPKREADVETSEAVEAHIGAILEMGGRSGEAKSGQLSLRGLQRLARLHHSQLVAQRKCRKEKQQDEPKEVLKRFSEVLRSDRDFEPVTRDGTGGTGEFSAVASSPKWFQQVLPWATEAGPYILLRGPACSGKSTAITSFAKAQGKELVSINAHAETATTDILGSFMVDGNAFQVGDKVQVRSTSNPLLDGKKGTVLNYDVDNKVCTLLTDARVECVPCDDVKQIDPKRRLSFLDGPLLRATQCENAWLLIENVNMAPPEAIERFNSLGESLPCQLHLLELGSHDGKTPVHPVRSDFRIFFTADPQRPTANRLSDAFLDRCTVIECQSFDKLYKKRCQAADAKSEIENTYLEAVKGLGVVHDVFQRSELLAQSLVELHAAALREEPNTRLYVAQHVCGAPLTARTLRRALTSMEAFSGPEAALELVFGKALLDRVAHKHVHKVSLCAKGLGFHEGSGQDLRSFLETSHGQRYNRILRSLQAMAAKAQVHQQSVLNPEVLRLSIPERITVRLKDGPSLHLSSATVVVKQRAKFEAGYLMGNLQLDEQSADRVCEFFWHLPYGRLNAEWQHAKDEEFISQAFAKPFLEAFIGQATVEAFMGKEAVQVLPEGVPDCKQVSLTVNLDELADERPHGKDSDARFGFHFSMDFAPQQRLTCLGFTMTEAHCRVLNKGPEREPDETENQFASLSGRLDSHLLRAECEFTMTVCRAASTMRVDQLVLKFQAKKLWTLSFSGQLAKVILEQREMALKLSDLMVKRAEITFEYKKEAEKEWSEFVRMVLLASLLDHEKVPGWIDWISCFLKKGEVFCEKMALRSSSLYLKSSIENASGFKVNLATEAEMGTVATAEMHLQSLELIFHQAKDKSSLLLTGVGQFQFDSKTFQSDWNLQIDPHDPEGKGHQLKVRRETLRCHLQNERLVFDDLDQLRKAFEELPPESASSPTKKDAKTESKQLEPTPRTSKVGARTSTARPSTRPSVSTDLRQDWKQKVSDLKVDTWQNHLKELQPIMEATSLREIRVLLLLDHETFAEQVSERAKQELLHILLTVERLRGKVQGCVTGSTLQAAKLPAPLKGLETPREICREFFQAFNFGQFEGSASSIKTDESFHFVLHLTKRSPAEFDKRAVEELKEKTKSKELLVGQIFIASAMTYELVSSEPTQERLDIKQMTSLPHLFLGLLLRAEQKAELKARPSRELREIPEELCDFKQSETAGKFGSFRHKVETDASTDTSKSSSSTKLQLYTRVFPADAVKIDWDHEMNKLEATSEAKLKGAPPDTDRFWSHDEDVQGLVEKFREPLRQLPPNLYTQVAPSKKGKLLSIPGLIQFVATGGANQNIWQARKRGGKVVRSISLVLDPGTFATEDPDEDFYVVALALARACSAENFSISVFHPAYGMLKDQSAGEHSWTEHSRRCFQALCNSNLHEGPYELVGSLLRAAKKLVGDTHAKKAESPDGVRHLLLLTRNSCYDAGSTLADLWRWLRMKQISPCAVCMGMAHGHHPNFETFVHLKSPMDFLGLTKAIFSSGRTEVTPPLELLKEPETEAVRGPGEYYYSDMFLYEKPRDVREEVQQGLEEDSEQAKEQGNPHVWGWCSRDVGNSIKNGTIFQRCSVDNRVDGVRAEGSLPRDSKCFVTFRMIGTHAAVGVGTSDCTLHESGRTYLFGQDEHSWALCFGRGTRNQVKALHNGVGIAAEDAGSTDFTIADEDLNFECMSFAFDITASGEMRVTLPKGKSLTVPFGISPDLEIYVVASTVENGGRITISHQDLNLPDIDFSGWTLHQAAKEGRTDVLKALLQTGDDEDQTDDEEGRTPLHWGAHHGHTNIVKELLAVGAAKDVQDNEGHSPLHLAAISGHHPIGRALLAAGAEKDIQDQQGRTPLHWGAHHGHTNIVKELLAVGAAKDVQDNEGQTAVDLARERDRMQILELLEASDFSGWTLLKAAQEGRVDALKALLDKGSDKVCRNGHQLTTNVGGRHGWRCDGVVMGSRCEVRGKPLSYYCKACDFDLCVNCCFPDQDDGGKTCLHLGAKHGHVNIVEELLAVGAAKDAQDNEGQTPLHVAVIKEHVEIARALLAAGAKKDIQDQQGQMPLHLAAFNGHVEIGRALLAAGAKKDIQDQQGQRPEDLARERGHMEFLDLVQIQDYLVDGAGTTEVNGLYSKSKRADNGLLVFKNKNGIVLFKYEEYWYFSKDGQSTDQSAGHYYRVQSDASSPPADGWNTTDCPLGDGTSCPTVQPMDLEHEGWTLHKAAKEGQMDVLTALLDKGADKDQKDEDEGGAALHYAALRGHVEIVRALLEAGAEKDIQHHAGWTPLLLAVRSGHVEVVQELVKAGAAKDIKQEDGQTALHFAARESHLEILKELLVAGATKEVQDNEGLTPLLLAAARGHVEIVKELIQAGASNDVKDNAGRTALHFAAREGHMEIVKELLAAGATKDVQDNEGHTVLHSAAKEGHAEIVKELLAAGATKEIQDNNGKTAADLAWKEGETEIVELLEDPAETLARWTVLKAAEKGRLDVLKALLEQGADKDLKDDEGKTALYWAVQKDSMQMVQALLATGAAKDIQTNLGHTALHRAAKKGHVEIVKELLAAGATKEIQDNNGKTAADLASDEDHLEVLELLEEPAAVFSRWTVHKAAAKGRVDVLKALLEKGDDKDLQNDEGQTALHIAANNGHVETVKELLAVGAAHDIQEKDGGWTALHWAARNGHVEIAQELLTAGAEKDSQKSDGWTPLHNAAYRDHVAIVRELLAAGVRKDIKQEDGKTAADIAWDKDHLEVLELLEEPAAVFSRWTVHKAAAKGRVDVLKALLEKGDDKDLQNDKGWTALHLGASKGHVEIVQALLAAGAAKDIQTNTGSDTPLHLAVWNNHVAIVRELLAAGAEKDIKQGTGKTAADLARQKGHTEILELLEASD
ncbi:Ankyrin-2 (ANK-2) (Ankyrin-B) (Brain ankyrin) (Non-erythroid ankyrin) [Durusdinium trenchii]|uniref:Ankyrin-2 (ANK-2) (Ankyrin-B) (Brain ankyrin) (Non-erythroid ankyrin) n=1 Tax=Durusdinium trenchii TaxID=1381693 RepID=A0ABP0I9H4_9DINO